MLTRGFALFLLVAIASPAWGGVLYHCAHDGKLRTACCCPSGHSHHGAQPALEGACCDVQSVRAAAPAESRANEGTGKPSLRPAPAGVPHRVATDPDALALAGGANSLAPKSAPGAGSSPIFIQLRMLLI